MFLDFKYVRFINKLIFSLNEKELYILLYYNLILFWIINCLMILSLLYDIESYKSHNLKENNSYYKFC